MLDRLFSSHLGYLEKGLDRSVQRQGLLANNLANQNTPNYKRKDLDFRIALDNEMGEFNVNGAQPGTPGGPEIEADGSVRTDKNSVDVEQEALGMAETELRYQAISGMTSRYFSGLKNVIREGR